MADESGKRRRGCFFYGCLASLVLALLTVVGGLLGLHYAKKMFNDFTDAKPQPLPEVRLPQPEIDRLQQHLDAFRQAVRSEKPTDPLELTADEINALIATDPDFSTMKGKLYVILEGDQVKGQLSVPLEWVGLPIFRGRYLNGTGNFSLTLHRNQLHLFLMNLVVKEKRVPEVYMEQIRKHNWAEGANADPRTKAALERIQEVRVQDSKLIVVPNRPAAR